MTTYLTIITTVLVLTQIIRITQNQVNLHRQNALYKKNMGELADLEIRKADFENQRKFYKLAIEKMEREKEGETTAPCFVQGRQVQRVFYICGT